MPDVSIMVSAQDNFSATIHRMQQAVNPFERSLTGSSRGTGPAQRQPCSAASRCN